MRSVQRGDWGNLDLETRRFPLSAGLREQLDAMLAQDIDACLGPEALAVDGVRPEIIFAADAWPHCDPDWEGSVFFTLTVEGGEYNFGTASDPDGHRVSKGRVFIVDPMQLHWLRPDPVISTYWLALQWTVEKDKIERFGQALRTAIDRWNAKDFVLPALEWSMP